MEEIKDKKSNIKQKTRVLGLDWGEKRVGVAISDPSNKFALPKGFIYNDSEFFPNLKQILIKNKITIIVVGLPLMLDGKQTFTSKKILKFIEKLEKYLISQNLKIDIKTIDESYSTNTAFSLMEQTKMKNKKKKKIKDALSAQIILDSYLLNQKLNS